MIRGYYSITFLSILATLVQARHDPGDPQFISFGKLSFRDTQCRLPTERAAFWTTRKSRKGGSKTSIDATVLSSVSTATSPISTFKGKQDPFAQLKKQQKLFLDQITKLIPFAGRSDRLVNDRRAKHGVVVESSLASDPDVAAVANSLELERRLNAITQPLIPPDIWESMTGTEFQDHPERLDGLAETGAWLAQSDESNEWIEWKVFGAPSSSKPSLSSLEKGDIFVWTGKARKEGYGSEVPFVKTRSIVPMPVDEMVELLLDSERVKTYNPWSLGRKDCWVNKSGPDSDRRQHTKIVKNRTQPPLGSKVMVSTTLLHARPWQQDGTWVMVSRSIGGNKYSEPVDREAARSDFMLGVNFLQPYGQESCILTSVAHVYSTSVPTMLAERLGVKSAIKFVKDMRKLKLPA